MINLTYTGLKVQCPNDWTDADAEDHFEMIEAAVEAAAEGLRNKLKEIHEDLQLEVVS